MQKAKMRKNLMREIVGVSKWLRLNKGERRKPNNLTTQKGFCL